jgi:DNA-binding NarL/FixJ family response regulator
VVPKVLPDLLILDVQLPDMDGFEVLRSLRRKRALIRTLVISSYFDEYTLCRIDRAAVQGFIDKSTNTVSELSLAISAIEAGSTYFPGPFMEARRAHSRNPVAFDKLLTDREQTILSLVGEPLSDAEIAAQLNLSPETVEKHRFNIMRKLGLRSRAEAARFARRCGLTRPPLSQRPRPVAN